MGKLIDMTGKRFGRLTVLRLDPVQGGTESRWICRCDCGNEVSISGNHLRKGRTKSCGCLRIEKAVEVGKRAVIDLTGKRFGRLLVLRRDTYTDDQAYWVCQCDCGTITSVMGGSLRNGLTRSCGCLRAEKAAETGRRNRKCL